MGEEVIAAARQLAEPAAVGFWTTVLYVMLKPAPANVVDLQATWYTAKYIGIAAALSWLAWAAR